MVIEGHRYGEMANQVVIVAVVKLREKQDDCSLVYRSRSGGAWTSGVAFYFITVQLCNKI